MTPSVLKSLYTKPASETIYESTRITVIILKSLVINLFSLSPSSLEQTAAPAGRYQREKAASNWYFYWLLINRCRAQPAVADE